VSPTPSASASPTTAGSPTPRAVADWPQYHRDALRTGVGPATPALDSPRRAWTKALDGKVYASPLIVGGRVIAATENDTVYSMDLRSGAVVWKRHLGTPVGASTLPCGDISPVTGITGTPAADPLSGQLYVVAFVSGYHHLLFVLNLADGSVARSIPIDPSGSVPLVQQQRPALALTPNYVYVAYGGLYGDCGPYHGYVVAVRRAGGSSIVYRTPTARESGVWTAMGVTVADTGDVYAVTGNGSFSSSFEYSNTVLDFSPDLKLKGYFAPANWRELDAGDVDLGTVGATVLPALHAVVAVGKDGILYLLREGQLGGIGRQVAALRVCDAAYGGTAWSGTRVFVPCTNGVTAVDVASGRVALAWRASGVRLASPIVAAGAVWAIDVDTSILFALDPGSGAVLYRLGLGSTTHFSTPAATQGFVVAPAGTSIVTVAVAP